MATGHRITMSILPMSTQCVSKMTVSADGGLLEVRVGTKTGNILASQKIAGSPQSGGFGGFGGRSKIVPVKINTLVLPDHKPSYLFIGSRKCLQPTKKHLIWQPLPMLRSFL